MSIHSLCDKPVEIHPRVETRGTAGSASFNWDAIRVGPTGKMWAAIQPARAFDRNLAKQDGYEISHTLYFPSNPQLQYHDQVWYKGRKFMIEGRQIDFNEAGHLFRVNAMETEQRQV